MESKLLTAQTTVASTLKFDSSFHIAFSNNFLPLLDNLSQLFLPFQFLEFIQIFFCILQFFESSFWVASGKYWSHTNFADKLHYITFFSSIKRHPMENVILFSVLFSIIVNISLIYLILFLIYKKTRRINKPLLYTIRIYFTFIGGAILHPLASLAGHLFNISIERHRTEDIVMLFFITICFIIAEVLFFVNQQFVNQSIYFHKSLFSTFDSSILLFLFISSPLFLFLSHLFNYYPTWSLYILIAFHIILIFITIHNQIWMSFTLKLGNSISISALLTVLFNNIFRIFAEFFPTKIPQKAYVIACFIVFFILLFVFLFIFRYYQKRIHSILSSSNFESEL